MDDKIRLGVMWYMVFLFSTVCHEAAHAWAALRLGDRTGYEGGQVSLNPFPHIRREPVGTVLAPIFTFVTMGWMMGWASTPYNFQWALSHPKKSAWMSLAGPVANLALVLLSGLAIRAGIAGGLFQAPEHIRFSGLVEAVHPGLGAGAAVFLSILFTLNLLLFTFNLMPLPPLDGSGVVCFFLGDRAAERYLLFIHHSGLSFLALLVAWKFFYLLFDPVYSMAIGLLYPGVYVFN
jgi:Zn-dependent protease